MSLASEGPGVKKMEVTGCTRYEDGCRHDVLVLWATDHISIEHLAFGTGTGHVDGSYFRYSDAVLFFIRIFGNIGYLYVSPSNGTARRVARAKGNGRSDGLA